MAGYYVGAFGDVRQMSEYWFGLTYLELVPDSVNGFYAAEQGQLQERLPYMGTRIRFVLDAFSEGGTHEDVDSDKYAKTVQRTYKRMSDGHHLDGLALVQTGHPEDPGYYLGAGYHLGLVSEAIHHGKAMTIVLGLAATGVMAAVNPDCPAIGEEILAVVADEVAQHRLDEDQS